MKPVYNSASKVAQYEVTSAPQGYRQSRQRRCPGSLTNVTSGLGGLFKRELEATLRLSVRKDPGFADGWAQ